MFESLPYTINENGYINYDKLKYIKIFQPKLHFCSAFMI